MSDAADETQTDPQDGAMKGARRKSQPTNKIAKGRHCTC